MNTKEHINSLIRSLPIPVFEVSPTTCMGTMLEKFGWHGCLVWNARPQGIMKQVLQAAGTKVFIILRKNTPAVKKLYCLLHEIGHWKDHQAKTIRKKSLPAREKFADQYARSYCASHGLTKTLAYGLQRKQYELLAQPVSTQ